jgi:hypothetical protein
LLAKLNFSQVITFIALVYRAILAYAAENADKLQSRDAQDRRLVAKLLLDFQRNGLALAEEKQTKVDIPPQFCIFILTFFIFKLKGERDKKAHCRLVHQIPAQRERR